MKNKTPQLVIHIKFLVCLIFFPILLSAQTEPLALASPAFEALKEQLQSDPSKFHHYPDYWHARFAAAGNLDILRILRQDFNDQFAVLKSKYGESDSLLLAEATVYMLYRQNLFSVWRTTAEKLIHDTAAAETVGQIQASLFKESGLISAKLFPICQKIPDEMKDRQLQNICKRAVSAYEYEQFSQALKEEPAPNAAFTDFAGKSHQISDFRGKNVLLHFWSTHSVPSMEQLPRLQEIWADYRSRNLEIISISYDPITSPWDLEVLKNFIDEKNMDWVNTVDDSVRSIHKSYRINNWPGFYLLNDAGYAVRHYFPPDSLRPVLERFVK